MTTEELQTRKLVSAYGGVGSIIETRRGALEILPFDQWPFARKRPPYGRESDRAAYRIDDPRLLGRLRNHFTRLTKLVRLPAKDGDSRYSDGLPSRQAAARYFPRWLYCSGCSRFHPLEEWQQKWHDTVPQAERGNFDPPRCGWCYTPKSKFHSLEQVRFVMTSPNGHLADVPWPQWALRNLRPVLAEAGHAADPDDLDEAGGTRLNMEPLPPGVTLRYRTAAKFGDLKGIIITAVDADGRELARTTLAGIFGLRVPEAAMGIPYGRGNVLMKAVLRSSTSVYYPNIVQSLFLPTKEAATSALSPDILAELRELHDEGTSSKGMQRALQRHYELSLSIEFLDKLIANGFELPPPAEVPAEEEAYRRAEYSFITQQPEGRYHGPELVIEPVPTGPDLSPLITALYRLDKLKLTSVQTSYTRQQPLERDAFLADTDAGGQQSVQRCYTTSYGITTHTLPAVESYGEGLFIELHADELSRWELNDPVHRRAAAVLHNWQQLASSNRPPRPYLERTLLLHSLSHLLIKELEFLCGYPATSLQERLYVGAGMQGILLYTIAGSEGSYGGLVSLGRQGKLPGLLRSALRRATDCAADPICWHTDEQGQGVGGLNMAACASCALLPETSCEEFNSLLDRRLVVDPGFGYFKELLREQE